MNPLRRAKKLLHSGSYTCVACDRDRVLTSREIGITPLLGWGAEVAGAAVADRVIGRAAALLLVHSGANAVYGEVMSASARGLLREAGVETEFGALVRDIRKPFSAEVCPLERLLADTDDPARASALLRAAMDRRENIVH